MVEEEGKQKERGRRGGGRRTPVTAEFVYVREDEGWRQPALLTLDTFSKLLFIVHTHLHITLFLTA